MLSAANLSKAYGDRTLFSGLTLNVAAGERIALVGNNGSGKTTFLTIAGALMQPTSGRVAISGISAGAALIVGFDARLPSMPTWPGE